ncbi:MAG: shikimate dehydrogenase [Microbacteriaceae bacterium]
MSTNPELRLAVIGHPIAHSKSPALYRSAYDTLEIPMSFQAFDVLPEGLSEFVATETPPLRAFAITMPHKVEIIPLLDVLSPLAAELQVVNAVVISERNGKTYRYGYNTDVYGIVGAIQQLGGASLKSMLIIGGGATATSAIAAARELGLSSIRLIVRNIQKSESLLAFAESIGIQMSVETMSDEFDIREDVTVATLPNQVADRFTLPEKIDGNILLDVAYEPYPTNLSERWVAAGGRSTSGLAMLAYQAVKQVRMHLNNDEHAPLEREDAVIKAMFQTLNIDGTQASSE